MTTATALILARPIVTTERTRLWMVAGCTAVAGALLLVAARIGTATVTGDGFARYVAEEGLRPGVVLGAALLAVPVFALGYQGLRAGSTARDRRMAGLRLGGATPAQVRMVAATESGAAAILGAVLALPGYLVLWLALGVLPSAGAKLVPDPVATDLAVWLALLVLTGALGAAAGAAVHRDVIVEPLGMQRRGRATLSRRATVVATAIGLVALAAMTWLFSLGGGTAMLLLGGVVVVLVVVASVLGTRLVRWSARRRSRPALSWQAAVAAAGMGVVALAASATGMYRVAAGMIPLVGGAAAILLLGILAVALVIAVAVLSTHLVHWYARRRGGRSEVAELLAAALHTTDPRTPGRLAGVLWFCGLGLGISTDLVVHALTADYRSQLVAFHLTGTTLATVTLLTAASVTIIALAVGASEQLRDARRPIASLAALGIDQRVLTRMLRRTLTSVATPAVVTGILVGGALYLSPNAPVATLTAVAVLAVLAVPALHLAARLVTRALTPRLRETVDPENLRTP